MKFYERRPEFRAEQFDGTSQSAEAIVRLFFPTSVGYQIIKDPGAVAQLKVGVGSGGFVLKKFDWLVTEPNGDKAVLDEDEMHARFEQVTP